jgi:hypothetical protein
MSRKILCVGGLHDGEHADWDSTRHPFILHYIVPLGVSISAAVMDDRPPELIQDSVRHTWYVPTYYRLDKHTQVAFARPEGWSFEDALFHLFGGPC